MTLAELRKARGFTQVQIAKVMGVSQPEVSRIERSTDMGISTLRRYVESLGGRLETVVSFPGGDMYVLPLGTETRTDDG